MADDKITYSDIIEPDDSIKKLISQMEELNKQYESTVNSIRAGADRIIKAIKDTSGATSEGRKSIDEAASSTSRLERAQRELKLAMSDTGKQIAWLKAQTVNTNKATVEQQQYIKQAISSYDRLKSDLKQTVTLYKSLTEAEREDSQMGKQLLQDIINLKNQISALDAAMKPHVQTLTEVQKAEQKLAFLQSEEGKRLLELKARIAEITGARKQQKSATDPLAQAHEKLEYAMSKENEQLKLYSILIKEANQKAQLNAQILNSAEGSYDRLSAQYALNKIKLNQMSQAQRETTESGKKLVAETASIYQQMIKLQEATGNYKLSVGHYQKTWDGLGISISQVVRELPAAAVSLNTFFLGISNNIPMLVDEINKLRLQNKMFQAEGKPTINITNSIIKSLFSWNTALVIVLTALSMYGKQIIEWVSDLLMGEKQVLSLRDALTSVNDELEKSGSSYGQTLTKYKELQKEWNNLDSLEEQEKWIKKNADAFETFKTKCEDVNDAEAIFNDSTSDVIESLKARAKAVAAASLASKKYEEALVEENKANILQKEGPSFWQGVGYMIGSYSTDSFSEGLKEDISNTLKKADALTKEGDAYFNLKEKYEDYADSLLKNAGIDIYEDPDKTSTKKGRKPKDPTDYLDKQELEVRKKYAKSLTDIEADEYTKRRKDAVDSFNAEVDALEAKNKKIQSILDNENSEYKKLTSEQVEQAKRIQDQIAETTMNSSKKLIEELARIDAEQKLNQLENEQEYIDLKLKVVKKGSDEELQLMLDSIEKQKQIALAKNVLLPESQRQDSSLIAAGFDKTKNATISSVFESRYSDAQKLQEIEFNTAVRTQYEISAFKLNQEKDRLRMQLDLVEQGTKEMSDTEVAIVKASIEQIEFELDQLDDDRSLLERLGFNDEQISAMSTFADTVISNIQDIIDAEVELAQNALDASNERVEALQEELQNEIEARNNGYANRVDAVRKELNLEKQAQKEKQKMLEEAQKKQQNIETITQISSLITASAEIWKAFAPLGIVGGILAAGMIATMFGSFAAAKVKARKVVSTQEYGNGGLEFLEGGSHASGNDIPIGKTRDGKSRRAEGGEALAIINRRNTRKYKKVLPDIINSLNNGSFENMYNSISGYNLFSTSTNNIDISKIEDDVSSMRKNQGNVIFSHDGVIIEIKGNVRRIIR